MRVTVNIIINKQLWGGGGGGDNFIVFSAVSRGGLWPKSGQAIARMPDRRLRPCMFKKGIDLSLQQGAFHAFLSGFFSRKTACRPSASVRNAKTKIKKP